MGENLINHLYTSYKDYEEDNSNKKLKYCSDSFIEVIVKWDHFFNSFFNKYQTKNGFIRMSTDYIVTYLNYDFCKKEYLLYIVNLFLRCRLYMKLNTINDNIKNKLLNNKKNCIKV